MFWSSCHVASFPCVSIESVMLVNRIEDFVIPEIFDQCLGSSHPLSFGAFVPYLNLFFQFFSAQEEHLNIFVSSFLLKGRLLGRLSRWTRSKQGGMLQTDGALTFWTSSRLCSLLVSLFCAVLQKPPRHPLSLVGARLIPDGSELVVCVLPYFYCRYRGRY